MPIVHISMCNLILRWYNRRNVNTNSLQFKWLFKALTSLFRHNKDSRGMIFAIEVQLWVLLDKNYCHRNAIKCFWARAISHTIRVTMTLWTYSLNRYTLCIRFVFCALFACTFIEQICDIILWHCYQHQSIKSRTREVNFVSESGQVRYQIYLLSHIMRIWPWTQTSPRPFFSLALFLKRAHTHEHTHQESKAAEFKIVVWLIDVCGNVNFCFAHHHHITYSTISKPLMRLQVIILLQNYANNFRFENWQFFVREETITNSPESIYDK